MQPLFLFLGWLFPLCLWAFTVDFSPLKPQNQVPLCGNCCEAIVADKNTLSCRLFGSTEVIWGTIQYKACVAVRRNESMCGPNGRYFFHYYNSTSD